MTTGIVASVGSKVSKQWPELQEGMRVLVKPHSGEEFDGGGVRGRIFESRDVLMIIGGPATIGTTECVE